MGRQQEQQLDRELKKHREEISPPQAAAAPDLPVTSTLSHQVCRVVGAEQHSQGIKMIMLQQDVLPHTPPWEIISQKKLPMKVCCVQLGLPMRELWILWEPTLLLYLLTTH